jgi:hypothetical protein
LSDFVAGYSGTIRDKQSDDVCGEARLRLLARLSASRPEAQHREIQELRRGYCAQCL